MRRDPPQRPEAAGVRPVITRLQPAPDASRSVGVTVTGQRRATPSKGIVLTGQRHREMSSGFSLTAVIREGIRRPVPKRCPLCRTTADEWSEALFSCCEQGNYICRACGTVIDEAGNLLQLPE